MKNATRPHKRSPDPPWPQRNPQWAKKMPGLMLMIRRHCSSLWGVVAGPGSGMGRWICNCPQKGFMTGDAPKSIILKDFKSSGPLLSFGTVRTRSRVFYLALTMVIIPRVMGTSNGDQTRKCPGRVTLTSHNTIQHSNPDLY